MPNVWYGGSTLWGGVGEPIQDVSGQWMPIGCSVSMGATDTGHDTGILIVNRVSGTVSRIYVKVTANTWASGGSWQLRLRDQNGGSPTYQATTIVINDGATGYFSDLTSALTLTAGNEYQWEWTRTGGGAGAMNVATVSYALTPSSGSAFQWNCGEKSEVAASATQYISAFGDNDNTSEINSQRIKMRVAGTITNFGARMHSNTRGTDSVFRLQKNGVDIGTGITFAGGVTGFVEDAGAGFPLAMAVDDYLSIRVTGGSGGGTAEYTSLTTTIEPTTTEFQCGVSSSGVVVSAGNTRYAPILGECTNVATVDGNGKTKAPFAMRLDRFLGYIRANSLTAAETATLNVRVNGSIVRSIVWTSGGSPATGEAFASNTDPFDVAEGDELDLSFVCTGASGSAQWMNLTFRASDAGGEPPPPPAIGLPFITRIGAQRVA